MSLNWKEAIVPPSASVRDAIVAIQKEALKIALVVEGEHLVGVVTDGDVRRGLLRKVELDDSVTEVMNSTPTVCTPEHSQQQIRQMLEQKVLLHMPIVAEGKLVDLVTWDQLYSSARYANPVVLMAGGFGKRLRPLTEQTPKPMLKVGEKPILETILEKFVANGFSQFFVSLHYLPEQLIDHFGDGSRWGASIRYVKEETPLGTAGALGLLPHADLPDLPIIVMNGDLLTGVDFEQLLRFHREQNACATMCVRQYEFQVPYGVVEAEGHHVAQIVEKPVHQFFVNAGIYVLNRGVVGQVGEGRNVDMPELLAEQISRGKVVAMYPIHEYWLDIGQKQDFDRAQDQFAEQHP